jgi:signal transduction histidine kinase
MIISDEELLLELDKRFKDCKNMLNKQQALSDELVLANKKLMESEALKTHFISSITNEIINPFASILGLSRNILLIKKENWDKARNMARLIHSEAFCLDFQFRNIFAAANIEAGEILLETDKINLIELIDSVVDSFRPEAEKKSILVKVENNLSNELFTTDFEKFKLIISNLISNAVKYNIEKGTVIIKLESLDNELILSVTDTGIGISSLHNEIIFDRFKRLDDEINSINRGHGLGLSIVKSLLELLDGTINVRSDPGKGSEFVLTIPESICRNSLYGISDGTDFNILNNNEIF